MSEEPRAPLRRIMSRDFTAYHGTRLMLECGHSLLSYSGRRAQQRVRCWDCTKVEAGQ
jgi:hypothetical protein